MIKQVTHIVPVGFTKEKLIEGIKQFPFHKIILVLGKEEVSGERRARRTAKEIERAFKDIAEVEYLYVDKEDVLNASLELIKAIKRERSEGREVMLNASGSLRNLSIACYISALLSNAKIYTTISKYEDGEVVGVEKVVPIPFIPIRDVSDEQMEILKALKREAPSIDELIYRMKPEIRKGSNEHNSERARVSHHLRKLKKWGLVDTEKAGKNLRIRLTKLGKVYVAGRGG